MIAVVAYRGKDGSFLYDEELQDPHCENGPETKLDEFAKWLAGKYREHLQAEPDLAAALHCTIDELYQPPEGSV